MARRTKSQIQEEVAAAAEAREKAYFEAQAKAKAGATEGRPELPAPDAYVYSYAWKQDPGAATGEYTLIKNPNPYYDASTNTVIDPVTGERRPVTQSMWSGPTTFRATDPNVKDPKTGLTLAQQEAADALAKAKGINSTLAAQLGAKVDPNTGKIIPSTIDPVKAATWYTSQNPNVSSSVNTQFTDTDNANGALNFAAQQGATAAADAKRQQGQSAYDLLFEQFNQYGLGALIEPLKKFIVDGLSPAEFTLRLRETDAYKKRFAANASRIQKGLRALSEAEYIGLEDQYQNVMRNYGLPASYYARGEMGVQQGFEKFIAGDVSAAELEDRIQTAQNRVINAAPEVATSLREFYPEITGGDILAYALDPDKALTEIRRKVGAAEIGAGAKQAGLATGLARAEELQKYGVTAEQARAGYQNIAELLPSATKLSQIYAKQGLGAYDQAVAEQEAFGISGAADAAAKRKRLTQLETAQFSGQTGVGALGRERAGQF